MEEISPSKLITGMDCGVAALCGSEIIQRLLLLSYFLLQ